MKNLLKFTFISIGILFTSSLYSQNHSTIIGPPSGQKNGQGQQHGGLGAQQGNVGKKQDDQPVNTGFQQGINNGSPSQQQNKNGQQDGKGSQQGGPAAQQQNKTGNSGQQSGASAQQQNKNGQQGGNRK